MPASDYRVTFEAAPAMEYPGTGYDLVGFFDCLHDMGDPAGAARHVLTSLAPDGTWLIVEPFANDDTAGNFNPVGRLFYSVSTLVCTPRRCPRRSVPLSAPRPVRPASETSRPPPRSAATAEDSPDSAAPPKPRSTWSSKPVRDEHVSPQPRG